MNYDFSEHDTATETSPQRQQLSAAMSRWTKLDSELEHTRAQLQSERASSSAYHRPGVASNFARQQHSDLTGGLQKTFDRLRVEEEGAKAEVTHFKGKVMTRRLAGRAESHRKITAMIIDRMRSLLDAVGEDRQFREQLAADGLRFQPPLHSIVADAAGGSARVDQMATQLEAWLAEIGRCDPYRLASEPAKPKRLQIA